jgi:hypothetical protein
MPEELPHSLALADAAPPRRVIVLSAGAIGVVLAGTIALWAHYGTAVFFEMIRTGFIACFG